MNAHPNSRIRAATPADIEAIYALWRELMDLHQPFHPVFGYNLGKEHLLKEYLLQRISEPNTRFFLFEHNGQAGGMLIASFRPTTEGFSFSRKGYIAETIVGRDFRNRGIGKQLFDAAKAWLTESGADHLELQVAVANTKAIQFWEAQGFTVSTQHMILDLGNQTEAGQ